MDEVNQQVNQQIRRKRGRPRKFNSPEEKKQGQLSAAKKYYEAHKEHLRAVSRAHAAEYRRLVQIGRAAENHEAGGVAQ